MKRLSIIVVLALALVLLYGGVAYANFGPHGGYSDDTDACAGCHRAHTSFSPITWTDSYGNSHSALLVSSASTMEQFCYACHGDGAPGASTNVQTGVFDAGPSWGSGSPVGPQYPYQTNSTFNGGLNGGGFDFAAVTTSTFTAVTSEHGMEDGITTAWGMGNSASNDTMANLTCTDCHDPHGSSNYRLLKDKVNGRTVGGYNTSDVPQPWVVSAEQGYPTNGWRLHEAGASDMATYLPNYTKEEYGWQPFANVSNRSISGWCSACHTRYLVRDDTTSTDPVNELAYSGWDWDGSTSPTSPTLPGTYDYGIYEQDSETAITSMTGVSIGARARHRHPVNTTLEAGWGSSRALQREVVTDALLPLEARPGSPNPRGSWDQYDYIGCLTCHVAHGTSVTMTGWAEASLVSSSGVVTWYPALSTQPTESGVNPTFSSALLRAPNRGVCERCHNK